MPIVARKPVAPQTTIRRPDVVARVRVRRVVPDTPTSAGADVARQPTAPSKRHEVGEEKPTYQVGYKQPPRHTRFQKGRSGNPKGRPKGAKSLKTLARELLTEKVTVRTATGPTRMTRMEAMLHKIAEAAFGGNLRALQCLLQLYSASVPEDGFPNLAAASGGACVATTPVIDMDAHDQAILDALRNSLRGDGHGRPELNP